jgi:hypothetical protein
LKNKYDFEQEQLQSPTMMIINQIKQGTYLSATQNEEIRHLLEKIYETNRQLIDHSDLKTQSILEKEWSDLQKSSSDIDIHIKQRSDTLVSVRDFGRKRRDGRSEDHSSIEGLLGKRR